MEVQTIERRRPGVTDGMADITFLQSVEYLSELSVSNGLPEKIVTIRLVPNSLIRVHVCFGLLNAMVQSVESSLTSF